MPVESSRSTASFTIAVTGLMALASVIAFLVIGAKGSWSFLLAFRGTKVAGMILVAYAIAISTVLFQTISNNRILTPSIIGFDALYALLQTVTLFLLGATGSTGIDPRILFAIETGVMIIFSLILFRALFSGATQSLHLLMLVGIILGGMFRSMSSFLQRILDPNDFVVLQNRLFASFNTIDANLLGISAIAVLAATLVLLSIFHTFDVLALGREAAVGLGIDHQRTVTIILVVIAVLVSVSTALVGPVSFFGLLVANLAWQLSPSACHRVVLPIAVFLSIVTLVAGQVVLERLLAFDTALGIVIEFAGGMLFIAMLMRRSAR